MLVLGSFNRGRVCVWGGGGGGVAERFDTAREDKC